MQRLSGSDIAFEYSVGTVYQFADIHDPANPKILPFLVQDESNVLYLTSNI
ncbi:MAG: hypothetical protein ACI35Z_02260 [Sphingobacterium hotanense]